MFLHKNFNSVSTFTKYKRHLSSSIIPSIIMFLLFYSNVNSQDMNANISPEFPFSILSIHCRLLGNSYDPDFIPSNNHSIRPTNGYIFEIDLNLKLENDSTLASSSIGVIISTPKGEESKFVLNPNEAEITDEGDYHFYFNVSAREKCFALCKLVWYNINDNSYTLVTDSDKITTTSFFLQ